MNDIVLTFALLVYTLLLFLFIILLLQIQGEKENTRSEKY